MSFHTYQMNIFKVVLGIFSEKQKYILRTNYTKNKLNKERETISNKNSGVKICLNVSIIPGVYSVYYLRQESNWLYFGTNINLIDEFYIKRIIETHETCYKHWK